MIGARVLDRFEFEIAAGIVLVGAAVAVGEHLHASRCKHLHYELVPERGNPATIVTKWPGMVQVLGGSPRPDWI